MKSNLESIYIMLLVFLPVFAHGQNFRLNINYAPSLPVGNFKNVTSGMSWRGWEGNLFYAVNQNWSIGIGTASQTFYKRNPESTFHSPGSDITAVVTNSTELMPVMLKVRYDLSERSIHPFIGLGAGINLIQYDTYYGEFVDYNHTVKFAAQPEIGLKLPFLKSGKAGLNLGAGYNFMPFKNDQVNNLNNISFKGGIDVRLD